MRISDKIEQLLDNLIEIEDFSYTCSDEILGNVIYNITNNKTNVTTQIKVSNLDNKIHSIVKIITIYNDEEEV